MKIKHCITAFAIAFSLTSCEKHEGELYLKSKCTAELNGKTYIDQTRIEQTFNPFAPQLRHTLNTTRKRPVAGSRQLSGQTGMLRQSISLKYSYPKTYLKASI